MVNGMFFKLNIMFILFTLTALFYSSVNAQTEIISKAGMISKQRSAELYNLLIQDCGSCHGMTMKGGLGPALTSDVLKNKSRKMIEATISNGRPGTPMPPWNNLLTKQEISWLVNTLYSGVKP